MNAASSSVTDKDDGRGGSIIIDYPSLEKTMKKGLLTLESASSRNVADYAEAVRLVRFLKEMDLKNAKLSFLALARQIKGSGEFGMNQSRINAFLRVLMASKVLIERTLTDAVSGTKVLKTYLVLDARRKLMQVLNVDRHSTMRSRIEEGGARIALRKSPPHEVDDAAPTNRMNGSTLPSSRSRSILPPPPSMTSAQPSKAPEAGVEGALQAPVATDPTSMPPLARMEIVPPAAKAGEDGAVNDLDGMVGEIERTATGLERFERRYRLTAPRVPRFNNR